MRLPEGLELGFWIGVGFWLGDFVITRLRNAQLEFRQARLPWGGCKGDLRKALRKAWYTLRTGHVTW